MNELTIEWIAKAEGDFATASREIVVRENPNYDAVCFHSQQIAEKYIKAFLQEHSVDFPKTHNLIDLLELCLLLDQSLEALRKHLLRLNVYAVRYRYPGETADEFEAVRAYQAASFVRTLLRGKLSTLSSVEEE